VYLDAASHAGFYRCLRVVHGRLSHKTPQFGRVVGPISTFLTFLLHPTRSWH
jgi:hypothetical protein